MGLILRVLIGILIGILIGLYAPTGIAIAVFSIKEVLGQFILFLVPLIIIFFITSGISQLHSGGGRTLGMTVGFAYMSTIIAASIACLIALAIVPEMMSGSSRAIDGTAGLQSVVPIEIPPLMNVMTALVLAFMFGIGIMKTEAHALNKAFDQGRDIVEFIIIKVMIPILPFFIAGVFVDYAVQGQVFDILKTFGFVLALAISMHLMWLLFLYSIAGALVKRNPLKLLYNMIPAYLTALGTMSSAATIPVTLEQTRKNKVSKPVTNFCIPLCATIHLSGSAITIIICAVSVGLLTDATTLTWQTLIPFIAMLGIVMVAAPGIPGGAVFAALGLLEGILGFDPIIAIPLMITLYVTQDSFGTACNVTGDGAIAIIIDKISGEAMTEAAVTT